ncbi:CheB methylesterase domain-containing protein [Thermodesulfitimonas sp.]
MIGVSTGGPRTLIDILPYLPGDLPAAVLLAQHMPESFTASLAERLDRACQLAVKEAADGDELAPGRVLVARGGWHLKVGPGTNGRLVARLSRQPADTLYFPSVDVTMRSVLEHVAARDVVGVLLTGMGSDGAEAMVEIRKRGGYTIAEAEETAVVWGMPKEAYLRGGAEVLAPSYHIAQRIVEGVCRG